MFLSQQFAEVARALPVNHKTVVSQLAPSLLAKSRMFLDEASLRRAAAAEINGKLPGLPVSELNLMVVYLLGHVLARLSTASVSQPDATAQRDKMNDQKDSISDMNAQDMLMLQQMMEKKGQLESMISNCMKAGYEGGQAAISALKAS